MPQTISQTNTAAMFSLVLDKTIFRRSRSTLPPPLRIVLPIGTSMLNANNAADYGLVENTAAMSDLEEDHFLPLPQAAANSYTAAASIVR